MRLRALKCKYCFPYVIKEELTTTCITQGTNINFIWDEMRNLQLGKKKICSKEHQSPQPLQQGLILRCKGEGSRWARDCVWSLEPGLFDAKMDTGRAVTLWLWGWQPVRVQHSACIFLWRRGKRARCWAPTPFFSSKWFAQCPLLSAAALWGLQNGGCRSVNETEQPPSGLKFVWKPKLQVTRGLHSSSTRRKLVCSTEVWQPPKS